VYILATALLVPIIDELTTESFHCIPYAVYRGLVWA